MKLVVAALNHNNHALAVKAAANAPQELGAGQAFLEKQAANDSQQIKIAE